MDIFNFIGKRITKTTGKDCSIFHDVASRYIDDEALKKLKSKVAVAKDEEVSKRESPTDTASNRVTTFRSSVMESSLQESSISDDDSANGNLHFSSSFSPFKAIEY